jgi:hypothetical protein
VAKLEVRLDRVEVELRFKSWFRFTRWLETRTDQELEDYRASDGTLPCPFPDPPPGSVRLDNLDRKALIKLWEEDQRWSEGRSSKDLGYYADHGHWPDQV